MANNNIHSLGNDMKKDILSTLNLGKGTLLGERASLNFDPVHKVLLVEDNPGDARLVEILLDESDFIKCSIVNRTTLGEALLELEKEGDYEAILLDLSLPDSRGFETLERLLSKFPEANVIVLTGLSDKNLGIKAVKAGAQDFLIKGAFDTDLLAKSLRYSIERSSVLKRLEETQRIAHIGSWEYNTRTQEITLSDEVYHIFGYSPTKTTLTYYELTNTSSPFYALHEIHQDALVHKSVSKDISIKQENGAQRHAYVQCHINKNTDKNPILSGIIQDITERIQGEELRKARDVAEQSAQLKEQFIASISHEMRTPMNAILGMSNLVLKSKLDEEQHSYVYSIKQSSEILLGIVNDILEFSTLQNGKVILEENDFDIRALLDNLVSVMRYKMTEKDLKIETVIPDNLPQFLKGDKLRLNQILYNLVGNAIKFTDKGYARTTLTLLKLTDTIAHIRFDIEDTGIGIPEDKLDAIFDTFTRVRTKDRIFEGTGLGLSITKNLILQQQGNIRVSSKLGVGSVFSFDLVFKLGKEPNLQNAAQINEPQVDIKEDRAIRLLLVEDHKMNQMVARKTLEKQWKNIQITIAENGQKGIEMLEQNDFDIVLMDVQMPIMDGYEATLFIRNNLPLHKATIPILVMTAHAHLGKDNQYREHGFDSFVLKPFTPEDLFFKIAKYARKS